MLVNNHLAYEKPVMSPCVIGNTQNYRNDVIMKQLPPLRCIGAQNTAEPPRAKEDVQTEMSRLQVVSQCDSRDLGAPVRCWSHPQSGIHVEQENEFGSTTT